MNSFLSAQELQILHFCNIKQLLHTARSYSLPLSTHATSIYFYKKFKASNKIETYNQKYLQAAILTLACKSENIHPCFTQGCNLSEKNIVYEYEKEVAATIKYDFNVPSPYLRILGSIVILQERGKIEVHGTIDVNNVQALNNIVYDEAEEENASDVFVVADVDNLWKSSVKNMDFLLTLDCYEKYPSEIVVMAAINVPTRVFEEKYRDDIIKLRQKLKDIPSYSEDQVSSIYIKIKHNSKMNK